MLLTGNTLGPYEIIAPLGAGGMGEVYRARDTRLGRTVAIKIAQENYGSRFEGEARAIAALNHPHVCTLYDVGPNYLVMELVEGETLAARLHKGPLPAEKVIRYGVEIADALAEAHAHGIIHRDLKPGNIMLTKTGVKVLDIGLAKSTQDETLTVSRMVMGTPAYMAPEQREGKECDARTDIHALGLLLSEMATGIRGKTVEPVQSHLAQVIDHCLVEDPGRRWQSAWDVKLELNWSAPQPVVVDKPGSWWVRTPPWVVASMLLVAIALASLAYFRQSNSPRRV